MTRAHEREVITSADKQQGDDGWGKLRPSQPPSLENYGWQGLSHENFLNPSQDSVPVSLMTSLSFTSQGSISYYMTHWILASNTWTSGHKAHPGHSKRCRRLSVSSWSPYLLLEELLLPFGNFSHVQLSTCCQQKSHITVTYPARLGMGPDRTGRGTQAEAV